MAKSGENHGLGECAIPGPVASETINKFALNKPADGAKEIREYLKYQARGERVLHLEKVMVEKLVARTLEVWDVKTSRDRYWVITSPTNLYSQALFPSADYTLSFHVGLTDRMNARQTPAPDKQKGKLAAAWRRLDQASKALDHAGEAEEFQAIGMRCRECLLALVAALKKPAMVPKGQDAPKAADFIHWSEFVADTLAGGSSASEVRGFLKAVSKSTWQLVSWLTHASNATPLDAMLAVDATATTLGSFCSALLRYEKGAPARCLKCGSYKFGEVYSARSRSTRMKCESCGWKSAPAK